MGSLSFFLIKFVFQKSNKEISKYFAENVFLSIAERKITQLYLSFCDFLKFHFCFSFKMEVYLMIQFMEAFENDTMKPDANIVPAKVCFRIDQEL